MSAKITRKQLVDAHNREQIRQLWLEVINSNQQSDEEEGHKVKRDKQKQGTNFYDFGLLMVQNRFESSTSNTWSKLRLGPFIAMFRHFNITQLKIANRHLDIFDEYLENLNAIPLRSITIAGKVIDHLRRDGRQRLAASMSTTLMHALSYYRWVTDDGDGDVQGSTSAAHASAIPPPSEHVADKHTTLPENATAPENTQLDPDLLSRPKRSRAGDDAQQEQPNKRHKPNSASGLSHEASSLSEQPGFPACQRRPSPGPSSPADPDRSPNSAGGPPAHSCPASEARPSAEETRVPAVPGSIGLHAGQPQDSSAILPGLSFALDGPCPFYVKPSCAKPSRSSYH
ncbi:hypothetical protein MAPG_09915 [Magnaporthiopsis poae ATCC 64411]|uniref:Uncharacterized protein n=1 Tax=Magnaporthiopsis poae (strain ATCC 64411 / 73-15) TaxID=644358 RepID=A0A0C4EB69_MAGP6|nr:hypothetical protein MAPG_09915 [Magnaporthiopsis poae ATCC 64411]